MKPSLSRHLLPWVVPARLWPRRLRWRLVIGFVLIVALLQAVLTGAERVLVQTALVGAIRANLETTVKAGLNATLNSTLNNKMASQIVIAGDTLAVEQAMIKALTRSMAATGATNEKQALLEVAKSKPIVQSLIDGVTLKSQLPSLTAALTLSDQPAAVIDTQGQLLAQTSFVLPQDKVHKQKLAPAVLKCLLIAAGAHLAGLTTEWDGQVATPDGPYLLLLWPTPITVLRSDQTRAIINTLQPTSQKPAVAAHQAHQAPLKIPDADHVIILIGQRLGETEQTVQTITAISLGGSLVVIVLAVLLGLLVVGRALRPLTTITHGAEQLARGDYAHRVTIDTTADEVGRLGAAFNHMAAEIAQAFATQRRFVADASHELRTPLAALRGYTDVLILGADEDRATADRVLHAMQDDLSRMSRLVNDLLTLARLDGGTPLQLGCVVLADLLEAAAHEGSAIVRGAQRITVSPVPAELRILCDSDRLRQVLSNVIGNACAYCPSGSTIRLSAEACHDWVTITVDDNGPGILPSDLARLGERFYRGDTARSRRTGGAGLGLAIARTIIEAHKGTLTIASTPGSGTAVTIRLPLRQPGLVMSSP